MRKIEQQMIYAIKAGKNWQKDNTSVTVAVREDGVTITSVYLHGNLIAQTGKDSKWGFCLCGWNTPTTRSRINAIIRYSFPAAASGLVSLNGRPCLVAYVNGKAMRNPVNASDWFYINY